MESGCVPRFTALGLRRYPISTLLRAETDVGTAAAMLGHSPRVMLRNYRKATMGDIRDALRKTSLGQAPQAKVVGNPDLSEHITSSSI
jgi:integrase